MFSVFDDDRPLNRRAALRIGAVGGLSLSQLLAAQSLGAARQRSFTTGKSVIFLLQQGGPSQHETFDPKIDAPQGVRTVGGVVRTSVPGVVYGATLAQLARHADKTAVVRSFSLLK